MATVFFNLEKPNGKSKTSIRMVFSYGDKNIILSTGLSIHPHYWNLKNHCVRSLNDNTVDYENINNRLKSISRSILARYNDHLNENGTLYEDKLKVEFREILRPSAVKFSEKMNFIKSAEAFKDRSNKKPWTKKHYQTAINILKNYETKNHKILDFADIDMKFYADFIDFMQDKKRNEVKSYAKNTIGSVIKEIKVFMNDANDIGLTECTGHLHRKFITLEETSDSIYLNVDELMKIYNKKFKNVTLDRVRDLFIIGCFTGLRYADLTQINPENFINKRRDIKIKTEKTGAIVIIPLHEAIIKILKKRKGQTPEPYRDQPMNRYLKIIARLAGLKDKISKSVTRGGMRVTTKYFKWQLVTVHTARRSFATNAFLAGVPTISIMKITGHKTEKAFMKYIKVSEEQNADLIRDHKFFKLQAV